MLSDGAGRRGRAPGYPRTQGFARSAYDPASAFEAPRCPRRQLMRDHGGPVLDDGRRRRGGH